jgi:hypothetical protein
VIVDEGVCVCGKLKYNSFVVDSRILKFYVSRV